MKQLLVLIAVILLAGQLTAQQRWTLSYQKKVRLKSVEENPTANAITIKRASLKAASDLVITFKVNDGKVNRTVMADDSSRSGIKNWDKVKKTLTIKAAELRKLFKERDTILFYFTEIPKDPALAAVVRMRPVHLFTLVVK
ncbi:MAG: hypothetical protein J0M10_05455 [Chitinophagales bacterium]|nr:hypothetical protein [Chitinophagales bacterium]